MNDVILNFLKEIITKSNQLEIWMRIVREYQNYDVINKLSSNVMKLTYEDKEIISNTLNKLTLNRVPNSEADKKEQEDLLELILIYSNLLIHANPFQKDRLKILLSGLNGKQQLAAIVKDHPLLLNAGPGSGKTRTVTYKIGVLIDVYNVNPSNILAVTFTNKAANEMKERIIKLCGPKAKFINMGTFHSICGKFLRQNIEVLNSTYNRNFTIIDSNDRDSMLKDILSEAGMDKKEYKEVGEYISKCKNNLRTPQSLISSRETMPYLPAYSKYQKKLRTSNLLDFDDMIMLTVYILQNYDDIREKYQEIWRYIHLDEYQDVNYAQYMFAYLLSQKYKAITVVGDGDQSIYGWRGADMSNILNFQKDFLSLAITLDTNYRSTHVIVEAARNVISYNKERLDKVIVPSDTSDKGDLIQHHTFFDDRQESTFVAQEIKKLTEDSSYENKDIMILYRINSLSRSLEEAMVRHGIPYTIVGGTGFYEREEIKDLIAYFKLAINIQDSISFERIYNVPARRISKDVFSRIVYYSEEFDMSFFQAALRINKINAHFYQTNQIQNDHKPFQLNEPQYKSLNQFLMLVKSLYDKSQNCTAYELLSFIIDQTEYKQYIRNKYKKDLTKQLDKIANIDELLNASCDYAEIYEVEKDTPQEFINFVSLIKDSANGNEEDFEEMKTLNDYTFNLKKDNTSLSLFGRYQEQQSSMYNIDVPVSLAQELGEKLNEMKNLPTPQRYSISNFFVEITDTKFVLKHQPEYVFEFTLEQMNIIIEYLASLKGKDVVRLMSMHTAKGLESKVVFVAGAEQGITPHFFNMTINLEEERRLFYVAITRPEELLYLLNCESRFLMGQYQNSRPSQFLKEIPEEYIIYENHSGKKFASRH